MAWSFIFHNLTDPPDTQYRLGINSLCTTADLTMTYLVGKNGGFCTGADMCSESETNADGGTDAQLKGYRERVPDTDDNNKRNELGEVVIK